MLRKSLSDVLRNKNQVLDLSLFHKDYQSFITTILHYIPEAKYLNTKANVSSEKQGEIKSEKNFYGLKEDEAIRGFSGLLRFKDVISHTEEDYQHFIECQIEMKKPVLKKDSFAMMKKHIMQVLTTPEDFAAQIWAILCNDLGKVHSVIDEYKKIAGGKVLGHDHVLAEMLQLKPELFPGFCDLPILHQKQVMAGFASGCDISMLEQLELPAQSMQALIKLDKKTLDRYILHTIYDVAGAAGAFKQNGSLTMHEETWNFFHQLSTLLSQLHEEKSFSIEKIYEDYLNFRAHLIGMELKDSESIALTRIAGLSRLATQEHGTLLKAVWNELTVDERNVLTAELNVHGGQGQRAIFIGYGVAMLINPQVALKPIYQSVVNQEGLKIGLKYLAQVFKLTRAMIKNDSSDQLFVAECDEVAKMLAKNPRELIENNQLTKELQMTITSDRRIDFCLRPKTKLTLFSVEKENLPLFDALTVKQKL